MAIEDSAAGAAAGQPQDGARRSLRHELRTPIHHILGCSELLLDDAEDDGLAEWIPALQEIRTSGQQALAIINESLDPAREDGPPSLHGVRDALAALMERVVTEGTALESQATALGREDLLPDLQPIRLAAHRLLALVDDHAHAPAAADARVAEPERTAVPLAPEDRAVRAGGRGTLLVVDDNAQNRDLLSRRLEREYKDHTVLRAENGRRALELLAEHAVDLVLLDILIPEMDGYEVLRQRQADKRLSNIPFIVISALDDMDSVVRCIEMGAEDYLPKPFDPVLLRARIGACLERKRLRDQELEYLGAVEKVTAAAEALEAGAFQPATLEAVADRPDELGGLARTFTSMVVALEAAHQAELHAELVRHELSRAREIQERLIPDHLAHWPGQLELAARFRPAREMSGDFYDVFELGQPTQNGATAGPAPLQIAVGDVAGKSIPAALVMALARTTLRAVAQRIVDARSRPPPDAVRGRPGRRRGNRRAPVPSPADTARLTGGVLHRDVGQRDFVCCALAVLEPLAGGQPGAHLRLVNAGQAPPLLCRDGHAEELEPPGERFPLGVLPEPGYEELAVELRPGDVVIFTSDGLAEAPAHAELRLPLAVVAPPAAAGELFGFERLATSSAYWTTHAADADGIAAGIWADVNAWSGETSDHDDMTLVVLRVPGI